VANLGTFDGRVYLVNAKYPALGGRPCFPSVEALPEVPDCVVVAAGREAVEPVVAQCAACGVGAVVVLASGYAETARPERVAAQSRLAAIAQAADMRLVGPNTIGLVNYAIAAGLTFSAVPDRAPLRPHAIGIVSQSGSLGFSLAQGMMRGVSVSHVLSAGNSCDVMSPTTSPTWPAIRRAGRLPACSRAWRIRSAWSPRRSWPGRPTSRS